jgi:hypothetical protein
LRSVRVVLRSMIVSSGCRRTVARSHRGRPSTRRARARRAVRGRRGPRAREPFEAAARAVDVRRVVTETILMLCPPATAREPGLVPRRNAERRSTDGAAARQFGAAVPAAPRRRSGTGQELSSDDGSVSPQMNM